MIPQCKKDRIIVNATEPTTNEKVWIQKGKNLINRMIFGEACIQSGINYNDSWIRTDFIPIKLNVPYIFSHSLGSKAGNICVFDSNFNFIEQINSETITSSFTITNSNAKYVIINAWNLYVESQTETWMQLEQGSIATEYEVYVEKKIWCKNDNGLYEEFVNQTEIEKTCEDLKGKVLWTNQNYTSSFEAQTVNVDLSSYNYIRVIYTHWGGSWSFLDGGKVPKGVLSILNHEAATSRRYTSNDEGVSFENPSDNGNTLCQVPIYIIGYKYW